MVDEKLQSTKLTEIRWITPLLVLAAVFLTACTAVDAAGGKGAALQSLDGEEIFLSDYEGQVILLNFWASWCGPCRVEMPELDAYYKAHQNEGFVLIAVNRGESVKQAREFIEEEGGFNFIVMRDPDDDLYNFYGLRGMPASVLLDGNGEVQFVHNGIVNQAFLEERITPLLEDG